MIEAGAPGIGDEGFVDDGGVGIVDGQKFEAHFSGELIAVVAFEGEGRAGSERCAVVFLLVGVTAEVIFFFEQEPVFALPPRKYAAESPGDTAADNNDVGFFGGVGARELVAVAHLMADFEMFAFDARLWRRISHRGQPEGSSRWDNRRRRILRPRI